jgi:hypothetical protein
MVAEPYAIPCIAVFAPKPYELLAACADNTTVALFSQGNSDCTNPKVILAATECGKTVYHVVNFPTSIVNPISLKPEHRGIPE